MQISHDKLLHVLQQQFGLNQFRPGQSQAIIALLQQQRLLSIQPTGYGKSLLYQLPAVLLDGITLVISPLLIAMLKYFGAWKLINRSVITENIWSVINAFIFLIFVFISYRILHFLMRYKFVKKIITYTSFSKYKFCRRYKAPKS